MTGIRSASEVATRPARVQVYGNDHSAWTQAVLLGLHEKEIAHTLVTVPPLPVFLHSGILMPAAEIDDGPWLLDSGRILGEIGFHEVGPDERRALQVVFRSAAMQRTAHPWRFWHRFSYARDGHPRIGRRLWNQFWRAFSVLYFFALITIGRLARPRATTEQLVQELSFFEERLGEGGEFLGGVAPDTVDLQLFGIVQMCSSIPGPSLEVLRRHPQLPRLRSWIGAMQRRFRDYGHLYSAQDFEPAVPALTPAPVLDRLCYWSGAALMWIAVPITLPTALFLARRVRKKGLQRA